MKRLAVLFLLLTGVAFAQTECEDKGDFKVCATGDSQSLEFPDSSWVGISSDHLVFYPLGTTYVFSQQAYPALSRDGALHCMMTPAFYYEKFHKIPINWRMQTAYDYWQCLVAQDLETANNIIMMDRHKDLRTNPNDKRYLACEIQYLYDHFGYARFDVYTLVQNEEAYHFARKSVRKAE